MTISALPKVSVAPGRKNHSTALQAFCLRMHFYVGIFVGPFLLISAITGVMYCVAPHLAPLTHHRELKVERVQSTKIPLSQQALAVQQRYPERKIVSLATREKADENTRVVIAGPGSLRVVFVDPYSGEIRGETSGNGVQVYEERWAIDLHRTLFLGEWGRNYAELSASWLWVLAITGLPLWWWTRGRRATPSLRNKRVSRHAQMGIAVWAGLVFLSASGVSWSLHAGEHIDQLRTALSGANPPLATAIELRLKPMSQDQPEWRERIDRVEASSRSAGLVDPLVITSSTALDKAWTVSDRERSYPLRLDRVSIHPDTGAVVAVSRFEDWPFLAQVTQWSIALHMGLLFGWANQLILAAVCVGLCIMIIYGYLLWWSRRPKPISRTSSMPGESCAAGVSSLADSAKNSVRLQQLKPRLPATPRRGVLLRFSPGIAVALVTVIVVVGWLFPLLGLSVAFFVVIDSALGLWSRRKLSDKKEVEA